MIVRDVLGGGPESAEGLDLDVVVNDRGQYSLWRTGRTLPPGWRKAGFTGTEKSCPEFVNEVWGDLHPKNRYAADPHY